MALTTHDVKVTRREETIKVAKADKEEAKLLNISIDEKSYDVGRNFFS